MQAQVITYAGADMANAGYDLRQTAAAIGVLEEIEAAMKGMLEPIYEEKVIAHAEVRQTFSICGMLRRSRPLSTIMIG